MTVASGANLGGTGTTGPVTVNGTISPGVGGPGQFHTGNAVFNGGSTFAVDLNGRVRQVTDTRGCEYEPAWSPDGKWIAYTATKRDVTTIDSVAEDTHVWVVDAGSGQGRELTDEQDRRARSPRASINFVTAHDGFTLADLVSYNDKHNEANLEGPGPGAEDNRSSNYGV